MKNKALPIVLFILFTLPLAIAGGGYVGSMIFVRWQKLNSKPSVLLLYEYAQYMDKMPAKLLMPFKVSVTISLLISILPALIILAAVFAKPKRELHGSSRFANAVEVQQAGLLKPKYDPKTDKPDLLIGKYKNKYLRWAGNEFLYLAAPTRSGKGVGVVIPNCLHYRDSMVVYDPKLENFIITGGFRQQKLGQQVFLFNPGGRMPEHERNPMLPLVSHRWNPMTYIRRDARYSYKDLSNMAAILLPKPAKDNGSGTFFVESARKLFVGLGLYMIETERERDLDDYTQRTTLANLFRLTAPTDGKPLNEWLLAEIAERDNDPEKTPLSSQCKTLLLGFANGSPKTGADILASLTAPLGIFLDPVCEAATSGDDFRLDELRKKRMTIYIGVVPTETETFSRLTNLLFSQIIDVNVQQGLPQDNKALLKYQCLLLMDEFTALGVIPAVQHGVSYIAGYELRLLIIIQAPSQVEAIYGRENMETFFTNFTCRIFYTPRVQKDAEEYSKSIGYETFKARSTSRSQGKGGSRSTSISDQQRAVMNPDEIKMMPNSDCIINLGSSRAIYAQKIVYWQDDVFKVRANLPRPDVPNIEIKTHRSQPKSATAQTAKTEPVPDEKLPETDFKTCANNDELFYTMARALVTPDSPPEYIKQIVAGMAKQWGKDSEQVLAKLFV